ncbi:MAG: hypothetical protein M3Y56_08800, partial [Armatimonadota bacterium]|nr:hypothetical protein [Armatimonadota bacterium]
MTDSRNMTGQTGNETVAWQTFPGKRVIVHAQGGSYASKQAPSELREAERAAAELEKLLQPGDRSRGAQVDIYLVDAIAPVPAAIAARDIQASDSAKNPIRPVTDSLDESAQPMGENAIRRVVQPEANVEAITWPLTRVLIKQWFGPKAASAEVFVNGIAGVIAARIGAGPSLEEANQWVRNELNSRRSVEIFGRSSPASPQGPPPAPLTVAPLIVAPLTIT